MGIISLADVSWIDIVYTHMDLNVDVSATGLFDLYPSRIPNFL